ncbi:FMN-dependent NADH-azoreductase [Scleromatobacter humisilvae]|uniref:FMN dependent NADH:quinone oxidoreductase n=1 Tax=Scleromatobacter humisilvae TaxID=2897159 RepID=A0A9X1YJ76_9BURK|nr:NAD(P)H-dependent oxidoreductase [Scleromatobacter humisilvae]MCK9687519.1 NAD(P)H-dependent oxidoreductase [Scleromatobacter humisilvae]
MNILQINSSARSFANGQGSQSTRLANELVEQLRAANPAATLTLRDLTANPHPVLDEATLGALFTPAEARSAEQHARVALDHALIDEVKAADVIVIGVPMVNFGITSQLKNWIDAIAKAGVTFKYTATGPVGLIEGKKVYAVLTRGGIYRDQPHDTQVPYLRQTLGFLGITDLEFIYAEGLAMGPDAEAKALSSARTEIARIVDGAAIAA